MEITADRAANFYCDSEGIDVSYECIGNAVMEMRCCSINHPSSRMNADWKKDIEENLKKQR